MRRFLNSLTAVLLVISLSMGWLSLAKAEELPLSEEVCLAEAETEASEQTVTVEDPPVTESEPIATVQQDQPTDPTESPEEPVPQEPEAPPQSTEESEAPAAAVSDTAIPSDLYGPDMCLKQEVRGTCTLTAAAMMVRRALRILGHDYSAATENGLRPYAWIEGTGMAWNFSFSGITVGHSAFSGTCTLDTLLALLEAHPEGIVAYDRSKPQAVLISDYADGILYCIDPASGQHMGVDSSWLRRGSQDETIAGFTSYWYVTSPNCSPYIGGMISSQAIVLTAEANDDGSIRLNWNQTGTGGYCIFRSCSSGGPWDTPIWRTQDASVTSWTDTDTADMTLYYYLAASCNEAGSILRMSSPVPCYASNRQSHIAEGSVSESLNWTLLLDGTLIFSGMGNIPDYYDSSRQPWAQYHDRIEKVILPGTINRVGAHAFSDCSKLQQVNLPASVNDIGAEAFMNCRSLRDVDLLGGLSSIQNGAFTNCTSLTELVIPETVTILYGWVFTGCSQLHTITFTGSAPEIFPNTFQGLSATICYHNTDCSWDNFAEQFYNPDITLRDGHTFSWSVTKDPTAEADGELTGTCTACGNWCTTPVPKLSTEHYTITAGSGYLIFTWNETAFGVQCFQAPSLKLLSQPQSQAASPGQQLVFSVLADGFAVTYRWQVSYDRQNWTDQTSEGSRFCISTPGDGVRYVRCILQDVIGTIVVSDTAALSVTTGSEYLLNAASAGIPTASAIYIDGIPYWADDSGFLSLTGSSARTAVTYEGGMRIWLLNYDSQDHLYSAHEIPELSNALTYQGTALRISGTRGFRLITSVPSDMRTALLGSGLQGYHLVEYGTLVCWANSTDTTLTLQNPSAMHNFACSPASGVDAIYRNTGSRIWYTNVLTGFSAEQSTQDFLARSYMILQSEKGDQFTLYGPIIRTSIRAIAQGLLGSYDPASEAYRYLQDVISGQF